MLAIGVRIRCAACHEYLEGKIRGRALGLVNGLGDRLLHMLLKIWFRTYRLLRKSRPSAFEKHN